LRTAFIYVMVSPRVGKGVTLPGPRAGRLLRLSRNVPGDNHPGCRLPRGVALSSLPPQCFAGPCKTESTSSPHGFKCVGDGRRVAFRPHAKSLILLRLRPVRAESRGTDPADGAKADLSVVQASVQCPVQPAILV
jgi:hypothetical protein